MLPQILVVFLMLASASSTRNINLIEACDGQFLDHTECSFIGHWIYQTGRLSVDVELIRFDSLRNSILSFHNLPNVKYLEIIIDEFDDFQPCKHIANNQAPVEVEFKGETTLCVSMVVICFSSGVKVCHLEKMLSVHFYFIIIFFILQKP